MENLIERRKDYSNITERLSVLETLQQKDLDTAEEWRSIFCEKIDKLIDILGNLPCKERMSWHIGIDRQVKFIWGVLSGMTITLIIIFGSSSAVMNTLREKIGFVEIHSYGVQDYENGKVRTHLPSLQE